MFYHSLGLVAAFALSVSVLLISPPAVTTDQAAGTAQVDAKFIPPPLNPDFTSLFPPAPPREPLPDRPALESVFVPEEFRPLLPADRTFLAAAAAGDFGRTPQLRGLLAGMADPVGVRRYFANVSEVRPGRNGALRIQISVNAALEAPTPTYIPSRDEWWVLAADGTFTLDVSDGQPEFPGVIIEE